MSTDRTKETTDAKVRLRPGNRVQVVGAHPWTGKEGVLVDFETYGMGWRGWRVALDNGMECYAGPIQLRSLS